MANPAITTLEEALAALPVELGPRCVSQRLAATPADDEEMEFLLDDGEYSDYGTLRQLPDLLSTYDGAGVTYSLTIYLPA